MARRNYVNNKDFLNALIEYFAACDLAEKAGQEKPEIPRYIAECIFEMSRRMSTKSNFSGYSFKDDMIMDGVENCIKYLHTFNPEKTDNPFAYFSTAIWNAFIRRIKKEKKQLYVKYKSSQALLSVGGTFEGDENLNINATSDYMNAFIEDYEDKMGTKK